MSFEYKYCKYKNKYLKLKENQSGCDLYVNIPKEVLATKFKEVYLVEYADFIKR